MLFQSFEFLVFLPIVFVIYWLVLKNRTQMQNVMLLIASYVFYGWWDWRFLSLIAFSSVVDYFVGLQIQKANGKNNSPLAKQYLYISLGVNLGLLFVFKYFGFFINSMEDVMGIIGIASNHHSLNIILPVGISFYTFQTLSYSIDIYRGKINAVKDPVAFFAFVSFFPQLVAGPIERASNLLPQFLQKRNFRYLEAKDGLLQIAAGLFKKLVIADTCAIYSNQIFESNEQLSGSVLLLGAVYFSFQIYGDFSGYSDIAIGTAKLFGIKLMTNFKTPYFSRDISEFWRRWHISLSTWFRDYVYIPLGGSRVTKYKMVRNTFIIFLISGFWHGANWTFLVWGGLNALYFIPLQLFGHNRTNTNQIAEGRVLPNFKELIQIGSTYFLTIIAWIFFRSENISAAFDYSSQVFSPSLFSLPNQYRTYLPLIALFVMIEWMQRNKEHIMQVGSSINPFIKWGYYYLISFAILYHLSGEQVKFIYFDF